MEGDQVDHPAIRIEITPRNYRARAIWFIAWGSFVLALSIVLDTVLEKSYLNPGLGVIFIGYGVFCAVQARRQVTRQVLHIDQNGIRSTDQMIDRSWGDVVMVWVGSSTGLRLRRILTPTMYIYTGMGVHYARRAAMRPKPLITLRVDEGGDSVTRFCERLRALTKAQVVDGTATSRRDAELALERST